MDQKAMAKIVEKFQLRNTFTYEELYDMMVKSDVGFPGQFKINKGIFGTSILFETYMAVQPTVTIKNTTVTVRRFEVPQREGPFTKGWIGGSEYFNEVCNKMRELLRDLTKE